MDSVQDPFREPDFIGDHRFFEIVDLDGLPPNGTLAGTSGAPASQGPYATSLVERCEIAWRTPFAELTCGQVRTLLSQGMGLEWLAKPALAFALRRPDAYVANYPGEMLLLCLQAAKEMNAVAPAAFRALLDASPTLIDQLFGWSRSELRRAQDILAAAQATVRGP